MSQLMPEATTGLPGSIVSLNYVFDDGETYEQKQADINSTVNGLGSELIKMDGTQQYIHSIDVNSSGFIVHIVSADLATLSDEAQTLEDWAAQSVTNFKATVAAPVADFVESGLPQIGLDFVKVIETLAVIIIAVAIISLFVNLTRK